MTAYFLKDSFLIVNTNTLSLNVNDIAQQSTHNLFLSIIKNNTTMYLTGVCGFLTLGLLTAISTFYNGFVFGYLIITLNRHFNGSDIIVKNVLPHSIEILGLILSSSIGFYLSSLIIKKFFFNKNICIEYKKLLYYFIGGYLIILISAYIESYVSAK